jgi:hypothetical protein
MSSRPAGSPSTTNARGCAKTLKSAPPTWAAGKSTFLLEDADKSCPSDSAAQALAARWDGFLKKIEQRYYEVLEQTSAPLDGVINNIPFDNVIIHNIANGLKNQTVTQLSEKMDGAIDKLDGEMDKLGVSRDFKWRERGKVNVLKNWMEIEYLKFEVGLFARAANKILENVKAHINEQKMHRCTQCGAELP